MPDDAHPKMQRRAGRARIETDRADDSAAANKPPSERQQQRLRAALPDNAASIATRRSNETPTMPSTASTMGRGNERDARKRDARQAR